MNNIREVARRAGVGIGTVSRVLNGHPSVRPEVRARVLDVVKQVNYVPNVHAQRMWKRRSNTICFLLANREILASLHGHIIRGVEEFCAVNHYSVLFQTFKYSPNTPAAELELPLILRSRGLVDGVILGGLNYGNMLERMQKESIPFTVFGNNVVADPQPAFNAVLFDDRDGAEQATEHFIRLGHRDIWFVGDTSWPWNARRHESYESVMKRYKLPARAITTPLSRVHHEMGIRAAGEIFGSRGPHPCTAIFAANDYVACGIIEAAIKLGIRVPGDASVIGFDALDEFRYYHPAITSVGADKQKIGELCSMLLLKQIEGASPGLQPNVSIPMELVERETCAPPPEKRN